MSEPSIDRQVLFDNERFVIGVLQAVSAATAAGSISQKLGLEDLIGHLPWLILITLSAISLGLSVLAAFAKHQYKIWDVKAGVSRSLGKEGEVEDREKRFGRWLKTMRLAVIASAFCYGLGLAIVIVAAWTNFFTDGSA